MARLRQITATFQEEKVMTEIEALTSIATSLIVIKYILAIFVGLVVGWNFAEKWRK